MPGHEKAKHDPILDFIKGGIGGVAALRSSGAYLGGMLSPRASAMRFWTRGGTTMLGSSWILQLTLHNCSRRPCCCCSPEPPEPPAKLGLFNKDTPAAKAILAFAWMSTRASPGPSSDSAASPSLYSSSGSMMDNASLAGPTMLVGLKAGFQPLHFG
eukprot:12790761-Alexandrium_andersonii.AAC.1